MTMTVMTMLILMIMMLVTDDELTSELGDSLCS